MIECCHIQFKRALTSTRRNVYALLREVLIVRRTIGDLAEFLDLIVPDILEGIDELLLFRSFSIHSVWNRRHLH